MKMNDQCLQLFNPWQLMRHQPALRANAARSGGPADRHRPLVCIDIETTGGSAASSRITEVGALRIENGRVTRQISQLLNPSQPIPRFITSLTGISDQMVYDAPAFAALADELELLCAGAIFIAHNVSFDYGFIKAEFGRLGRSFNMDRLCSVQLDRRLHPEQARHGLDRVIERLGIEVAHRHRAYDDAEVIYKFLETEYRADPAELFRAMERLLQRTKH